MQPVYSGPLTVPALFLHCYDRGPHRVALHFKQDDAWRSLTWHTVLREVSSLARALQTRGVGEGVPVGILADTCKEWTAVDTATLALRGIVVGIYPTLLPDQIAYILDHAGVEVLVVQDAEQLAKIEAVRDRVPSLREVFSIEPCEGVPSFEDVREEADIDWFRARVAEVQPADVASLIYTSGTTGNPKGAVLTHHNFASIAVAVDVPDVRDGERGLIWLPLAHALQRVAGYRSLLIDGQGWYVDGIDQLAEAIGECRPTLLASVPRMLEKIHARAEAAVLERGPRVKRIYDWAFRVGRRRTEARMAKQPVPLGVRVQYRIADRLVFSKIRARLGGDCRAIVSGGAALNPEVAHWFYAAGIPVLEGWGLTETAAPATCNREDDFRIGTVGKAIAGVELKIADDGEILVKTPGLFQGYFKDPDATAAAITDGWFHTGDIGEIDADGFLRITDRKKEILITAGGKNVPPVNIEKRIEWSPWVISAVAIGDGRPYIGALLVPDSEAIATLDLPDEPWEKRVERPEVRKCLQEAVDAANEGLARYEQVKRWVVLPEELSVEGGELTPTLKLKRRVVADKYADQIEALYA